jgi:prevent-host-death family protein
MESIIGSYEAKTHLPQLLERVSHGERITITRRGVAVARLVPITDETGKDPEKIQRAIDWLLEFREQHPLGDLKIKDLINEGRRF